MIITAQDKKDFQDRKRMEFRGDSVNERAAEAREHILNVLKALPGEFREALGERIAETLRRKESRGYNDEMFKAIIKDITDPQASWTQRQREDLHAMMAGVLDAVEVLAQTPYGQETLSRSKELAEIIGSAKGQSVNYTSRGARPGYASASESPGRG